MIAVDQPNTPGRKQNEHGRCGFHLPRINSRRTKLNVLAIEQWLNLAPEIIGRGKLRELFGKLHSELNFFILSATLRARNNMLRKLLRLFVRQFSITVS